MRGSWSAAFDNIGCISRAIDKDRNRIVSKQKRVRGHSRIAVSLIVLCVKSGSGVVFILTGMVRQPAESLSSGRRERVSYEGCTNVSHIYGTTKLLMSATLRSQFKVTNNLSLTSCLQVKDNVSELDMCTRLAACERLSRV